MIQEMDRESVSDLGAEVLHMLDDRYAYHREAFLPIEDIREEVLGDHYIIARDFLDDNPDPSVLSARMGKEHAMHQLTVRSERARLGSTLSTLRSRLRQEFQVYLVWNSFSDYGKCYGIGLCRESLGEVIDRLRRGADVNYNLASEMSEVFDKIS